MNRRRRILLTTAAAAAAAGAGVAWWRNQGEANGDAAAIWRMRFPTPVDGELALGDLRGRPLLLNFWATWCPPCVSELPLLDRFHREQRSRGWQVVGLAVDNLGPVREFLSKLPVSFPIGLAGAEGAQLSRAMGNSSGALPFTLVFDRRGGIFAKRLGVIQPSELQAGQERRNDDWFLPEVSESVNSGQIRPNGVKFWPSVSQSS